MQGFGECLNLGHGGCIKVMVRFPVWMTYQVRKESAGVGGSSRVCRRVPPSGVCLYRLNLRRGRTLHMQRLGVTIWRGGSRWALGGRGAGEAGLERGAHGSPWVLPVRLSDATWVGRMPLTGVSGRLFGARLQSPAVSDCQGAGVAVLSGRPAPGSGGSASLCLLESLV